MQEGDTVEVVRKHEHVRADLGDRGVIIGFDGRGQLLIEFPSFLEYLWPHDVDLVIDGHVVYEQQYRDRQEVPRRVFETLLGVDE